MCQSKSFDQVPVTLRGERFVNRRILSSKVFGNVDVRLDPCHDQANAMLLELESHALSCAGRQRILETHTVRYPATWWDHCKQDLLPAWVKQFLPVRYAEQQVATLVQDLHLCPHSTRQFPEHENEHMMWLARPQMDLATRGPSPTGDQKR